MQRDPRAFLWDVREAALAIQSFTAGMEAAAFATNEMAQSAVERKFEIINEALNQLAKLDAALAARIPDLPRIVAFRNRRTAAVWAAKLANQLTVTESAIWLKLRKLSQIV